jgi:hypothetical protein
MDMNSILDQVLDDIADLPSFAPFPNGAHRVTIKFEEKEVNKHPSVELQMKALETLELADPTEVPLVAGAETSVLYMLDNEFGLGKLKEVLKPLGAHFGVQNLRAIMEAANGTECMVVTSVRGNKDKTQFYTDVKKLDVV